MSIPRAFFVILICCFGFYGFLRFSLWGQQKVKGDNGGFAIETPKDLNIESPNEKIIETLKSKEMTVALKKIESLKIKTPKTGAVATVTKGEDLSHQLSSDLDIVEFRSWVDKNFESLLKDQERMFDSMAYVLLDSRQGPLKYEKIQYVLEKMPPLREEIPAERDLYLKVARDLSIEAKSLVPYAFMKLATHLGMEEEQKYIECVRFISQRTDAAEIISMVDFYSEKNPHYREKMNQEFKEIVRPQ